MGGCQVGGMGVTQFIEGRGLEDCEGFNHWDCYDGLRPEVDAPPTTASPQNPSTSSAKQKTRSTIFLALEEKGATISLLILQLGRTR